MNWHEVREHFPHVWLLVEAVSAHSEDGHRILDDFAVLGTFSSGKGAMDGYIELHDSKSIRESGQTHSTRA